jgi:hypothetical protein
MVKEIIQIKLDELQEELEVKIADRMRYGKGPEPPSISELVRILTHILWSNSKKKFHQDLNLAPKLSFRAIFMMHNHQIKSKLFYLVVRTVQEGNFQF